MDGFLDVLAALAPSVGVGLVFWFVMRAVIHADRRERQALARLDAEERAAEARAARPSAGEPSAR